MGRTIMEAIKEYFQDIDNRYLGVCFSFNIRMFIYLGCWPLQPEEKYLILKYIRILKYLLCIGGVGATLIFAGAIIVKWGNIEKMLESIAFLIVVETAMIKDYLMIFKMGGVFDMVRILEEMAQKCLDEKNEMKIFQSYKRAGNHLTFWYGMFCVVAGFSYGIMPMFREGRRLPADMWCPLEDLFEIDCTATPVFEVLYPLAWLVCIGMGVVNAMVDTLCMSLLLYTIAQFRILQYRMENTRGYALKKVALNKDRRGTILKIRGPRVYRSTALCKETVVDIHAPSGDEKNLHEDVVLRSQRDRHYAPKTEARRRFVDGGRHKRGVRNHVREYVTREERKKLEDETRENEVHREINLHLIDCIKNQQMLFRFSELLQHNFGNVFFSELLFAGLIICILLFLMVSFDSDLGKTVEWGSIFIVAVVQLFAFCWISSELAHQSTLLNDALYYSDWVSSPPEFKRMMRTVMSRALHPVQLSAGGFLPFSVMQFQAIMQSAYSSYATLREFNDANH